MSKAQAPRALMKERLKAESEEELCLSKEEIQRKQQLLGSTLNPRVVLHRVRVPASPAGLIQDLIHDLKEEILETSQIKEEPEEQSIKQEEEHLTVCVPESSPAQIKEEPEEQSIKQEEEHLPGCVPESSAVKTEESSLLQQTEPKEEETQGVKISTEPQLRPETEGKTEHSSHNDNGGNWKLPLNFSNDGVTCNQVQIVALNQAAQNPCLAPKWSAPEMSVLVLSPVITVAVKGSRGKIQQCPVCKRIIKGCKNALKQHFRVHTGEKPYSCSFCERTFRQMSALTVHKRTHTGEKPYKCSMCDKSFAEKSTLHIHKRTHTGEKPYSCPICNKTFAYNYLYRHIKTHTGERPFSCYICNKQFTRPYGLKCHLKVHMREKRPAVKPAIQPFPVTLFSANT